MVRLAHESLPDPLPIAPVRLAPGGSMIDLIVKPPGSKSITNRALLLAALADGRSVLRGALVEADDARRMIDALRALGAQVHISQDDTIIIEGVAGRWRPPDGGVILNLNNAGTATRFLAAAALLSPVPVTVDGNERMRQRPIGELADALETLGAVVEWLGEPGCPPMRIVPPARLGDEVSFARTQSSQFISALMLVAPWLQYGLTIRLTAEPTSASYLRMSLELLAHLGAQVRTSADLRIIRVGRGDGRSEPGLDPFELDVEPDASGATYFWGAAAILPGARVRIAGVGEHSMQGDALFPELLARMGAKVTPAKDAAGSLICQGPRRLKPIMADMSEMPDAAVTLAVVAAFAEGTSVLRGVRTLRVKESDRIAALATELGKVGVEVNSPAGDDDTMTITPPAGGIAESGERVEFDTYQDHRMAMALALVGLRRGNVWIRDPGCVGKTFPRYWDELARLRE